VEKTLTFEELDEITTIRALFRSGEARKLRDRARASQSLIAAAAACHWTAISKLEAGLRVPRPEFALRLAAVYKHLAEIADEWDPAP
jgi:hypothetical protein